MPACRKGKAFPHIGRQSRKPQIERRNCKHEHQAQQVTNVDKN